MAGSQFAKGSTVFVPDEQEAYLPARVASCQGFGATAILRVTPAQGGGAERVVPAKELALVCEADPLSLEGANDLVKYTQLTDAAVLHGLRARYARDDIYTCAGSILVSVNPFKQVPSYSDALMARCRAAGAKELHEMPPHVFVVAESAFRGMLSEGKQQAILISGESGAGKTEAAKYCLRYIVARCGVAARDAGGASAGGDFVEQCLMQANPVLEAFGNAKTVRNGNSSRFGKWTEIQLDASGFIAASRITSYLLEKSRVAEHAAGERNYHVLYQLCAASSSPAERAALQLLPAADFRYLGESARVQLPGVDDAADWRVTSSALQGFVTSADEMAAVRRVLAAVLHLGNLHFAAVQLAQQDDGSAADAASAPRLASAAALLGLDSGALAAALTVKSVGKFPVVQVPQPPSKAAAARDALAKAMYGALFGWVLSRINGLMAAPASSVWDARRTIGLLDIFGFESFARNSLEQFLINFANEKLQQFFNEYIFRMEEAECRAEGVECPVLEFADNTAVASADP